LFARHQRYNADDFSDEPDFNICKLKHILGGDLKSMSVIFVFSILF